MRDVDGFAAISDYGFLSDCRSAALVARDGSIDWCCWPRFDSPSLFGALLDPERGGKFSIRPTGNFEVDRQYIEETNVLQTTFHTPTGVLRLTDWLHMGARQALCRLAECLTGTVEIDILCDPRPNYGASGPVSWVERLGWLVVDDALMYEGAGRRRDDHHRLVIDGLDEAHEVVLLCAGEERGISLGLDRPGPADLHLSLKRAVRFWQDWSRDLTLPATAPSVVSRSALTLKGLQYQPSGAIVAAATTSLPEKIGGQRNWDYRYSWLRDAAFTLGAFHAVGQHQEALSWFDWLKMIALQTGGADLQIMYGIGGEDNLTERELPHLRGYKDSKPVRVGNDAADQRQIDTYGEVVEAIWLQRVTHNKPLHRHRWRLVKSLADRAMQDWREPDDGIWEVRGGRQHFVYSKVMCWAALHRAIELAELDEMPDAPLGLWRQERNAIREQVLDRGFDPKINSFTQAYGSGNLDASNLLLAQVGFVSSDDPRFVATVRATQRELTRGGLVDRYQSASTNDGFADTEATFSICSLWLCLALASIGDRAGAREIFDRVAGCANDLGLLSEELTPAGEQLGNFPQAFTHIALIACAFTLAGDESEFTPTDAATALAGLPG
jgi:GH15 family glucan-1,4-alpha-glucosidase